MENFLNGTKAFLDKNAANVAIAIALVVAGYVIALIVRWVIAGAVNRTGLGAKAKAGGSNMGRSLGQAFFWLVWLVFILMAIARFPLVAKQLEFLNTMMNDIFAYLPKLFVGGIVLAVGVMLAKVIKNVISSMLEVAHVDSLAAKYGVGGGEEAAATGSTISGSIAKIVSVLVIITFAITAIGIWDIPGISEPVSEMLDLILAYIPKIIGATIILGIAVFIGRFVSNLAQSTLPALGLDNALANIDGLDGEVSSFKPSKLIGTIGFIAIALLGLTAATSTLDIPAVSNVFQTLLALGGKIILGAVIIGAGVFIANLVMRLVKGAVGETMANAIRYIIIILIAFMGLSEMDLGDGIVETAFSAAMVAAAVAAAIAFGLGGREWAKAKLQEHFPAKRVTKK